MTYLILVPVVAIVATLLVSAYLRYASAKLSAAARVWPLVEQGASKLISDKVPAEVREMAFRLGVTTGCGCYAFGVVVQHFAPGVMRRDANESAEARAFADAVKSLQPTQKRQLDTLIAAALAYDTLANPLIGFFTLRVVKIRADEAKRLQDLPAPSREAREAVFQTLGTKRAQRHERQLCAA